MYDEMTQRLRDEMQRQRDEHRRKGESYGYKDLLKVLHYGATSRISNIFTGNTRLTPDRYEALATEWGVSVDYLLCKTKNRTDKEIYNAAVLKDKDNIETHTKYLGILGYEVKPRLLLTCTNLYVFDHFWPLIRPTLTEEALNTCYHRDNDGEWTLADWESGKAPYLEITAGFSLPVKETISGKEMGNYKDSHIGEYISYSVDFEVYRDSTRIAIWNLEEARFLFRTMDEYASVTVRTMLEKSTNNDILDTKQTLVDTQAAMERDRYEGLQN